MKGRGNTEARKVICLRVNVAVAQHELSGIRLTPLAPVTFVKNMARRASDFRLKAEATSSAVTRGFRL